MLSFSISISHPSTFREEPKVEFIIENNSYVFNTSEILVENGKIKDGVLSSLYFADETVSRDKVDGFDGKDDLHGYFMPLKITESTIDDTAEITAVFMGNTVDADILKSGDSYYAVILLSNNNTLKFNGAILSITIETSSGSYSTDLELVARKIGTEYTEGVLFAPPWIFPS